MSRYYALVLLAAGVSVFGGWFAAAQTPPDPVPTNGPVIPPVRPVEAPVRLADLEVQLKVAQLEQGPDHPNILNLKKKIEFLREFNRNNGLRPDGTNEETGRFTVTSTSQAAVLVDTRTGESWYLRGGQSTAEGPVWVPIKRLAQEPPLPPVKVAPKASLRSSR